jgi:hypothetical protein
LAVVKERLLPGAAGLGWVAVRVVAVGGFLVVVDVGDGGGAALLVLTEPVGAAVGGDFFEASM